MMAAALFFLSCEEETTLLGYKTVPPFNVRYYEIPLETSVILFDSIRTSNLSQETVRFLTGRYSDDLLGDVSATAYTQFFRTGTTPDSLSYAVFDSISLHLAYDLYYYGSGDPLTQQEIAVYELADTLVNPLVQIPLYYSNTSKPLGPQIGSKTFVTRTDFFQEIIDDDIDTTLKVSMALDPSFGQRILETAAMLDGATSAADSVYTNIDEFVELFKGIAVVPVAGDKVIGFSPTSASSRIVVHFHINKRDSLVLNFSGLSGFSQIQSDRSASDVAGLDSYHTEFLPASGNRYLQNGVAIFTELKLDNFLSYVDTIPTMIINKAELVIDQVPEKASSQPPPSDFTLRVMTEDNKFKFLRTAADSAIVLDYGGTINSAFSVMADNRSDQMVMSFNNDDNLYNGFMALFLQELYRQRSTDNVIRSLGMYPISPSSGKSVNNVSFDQQNVKLRLYYTVPAISTDQ